MKMYNTFMSKSKLILFIIIGLKMVSCSNEDLKEINKNEIQNSLEYENLTLEKLGYNSYEDILHNEWSEISQKEENYVKTLNSKNKSNNNKKSVPSSIYQKITRQNLNELGYNQENKLVDLYYKSGTRPDGICVNDYKTSGSYSGYLLSDRYNWYSYLNIGTAKIKKQTVDTIYDNNIASVWVYNHSDTQTDKSTLNYTFTKSQTNNWQNTSSLAVAVGAEFGVSFLGTGGKGKIDITFENSFSNGSSSTETESIGYTYWVELPPKTKRQVIIARRKIVTTIECEIPVNITGYVGANFPKKVDGHYFWGLPANLLLKNKPNKMIYKVSRSEDVEMTIYGGPNIKM